MKERIKAIVRIVALGVLFTNSILAAKGLSPIPFDEQAVTETVSDIATGLMSVYVWWKNNNLTKEAQSAQLHLNELKKGYNPDDKEMDNMENEKIEEGELHE